jgi:alkylation response protein AidB-like acyl-CoA dehydrogenase
MRASGSHDVVLEDVRIPFEYAAELKFPEERAAPDATQMAWVSALFSTVYDGAARAGRDWFITFLRDRAPTNLGASLATLPRMQEALGEIDSALYASRVLLSSLAGRVDRGDAPPGQESLYVKHNVTRNALFAVSKALEMTGNPGLAQANPLERHYRDVLCARVHSPQNDSIFLSGGRWALAAAGVPTTA